MARPQTAGNGQIQRREERPGDKLLGLLQRSQEQISNALPKHVDAGRMVRIATTALRSVRNLDQCDPGSFLGCVMQAAQLGIEPNTPLQHAWLIPRRNRGGHECTLIIGYQGMMELAMRSGVVTGMYAYVVREGDDFAVKLGLEPDLHHVPSDDADREDRPITHVYAVAKIRDGEPIFVALSRAQVEKRRAKSDGYAYQVKKGGKSNPWFTDEEAMFQKTALRALWKWLPKSAEMARAVAVEEAAELGRQQEGFAVEVSDVLKSQGVDEAIDTTAEPVSSEAEGPESNEGRGDGNGVMSAEEEAAALGGQA
jgi:recombination protein RecT